MNKETRNTVKDSLMGMDRAVNETVGVSRVYFDERMSDEDFKRHVEMLSKDILLSLADAKKRYYEEGFKASQKLMVQGQGALGLPGTHILATHNEVHPKEGITDTSEMMHAEHELKKTEQSLFAKVDELIDAQGRQKQGALFDMEERLAREVQSIKRSQKESAEEVQELVGEQRALLSKANSRLSEISKLHEEVSAKLTEGSPMHAQVEELASRLNDQSNSIFNLQLHKERDDKNLETLIDRIAGLQKTVDDFRDRVPDSTAITDMISDNTSKINALRREMLRFNRKLSQQGKRVTLLQKQGIQKRQFASSLKAIRALINRRKKVGGKRRAKVSRASSKVGISRRVSKVIRRAERPLIPRKFALSAARKAPSSIVKTTVSRTTLSPAVRRVVKAGSKKKAKPKKSGKLFRLVQVKAKRPSKKKAAKKAAGSKAGVVVRTTVSKTSIKAA